MDRETALAAGNIERREHRRISLDANVRVRAPGSPGPGILCRVSDSSARGMRLVPETPIDRAAHRLEVLTESGRRPSGRLLARVVWIEEYEGSQQVGCMFDV